MACCCCISDDEVEGDKYGENTEYFLIPLKDAPCTAPCCCIGAFIFCPCAVYNVRVQALENDMKQYTCCQGYYANCTKMCDQNADNCPECCLCLEATLCISCSISATRMLVMDQFALHSDAYDRKMIRISNMCQFLSVRVCNTAAAMSFVRCRARGKQHPPVFVYLILPSLSVFVDFSFLPAADLRHRRAVRP